jgi:hypothetical protein
MWSEEDNNLNFNRNFSPPVWKANTEQLPRNTNRNFKPRAWKANTEQLPRNTNRNFSPPKPFRNAMFPNTRSQVLNTRAPVLNTRALFPNTRRNVVVPNTHAPVPSKPNTTLETLLKSTPKRYLQRVVKKQAPPKRSEKLLKGSKKNLIKYLKIKIKVKCTRPIAKQKTSNV